MVVVKSVSVAFMVDAEPVTNIEDMVSLAELATFTGFTGFRIETQGRLELRGNLGLSTVVTKGRDVSMIISEVVVVTADGLTALEG